MGFIPEYIKKSTSIGPHHRKDTCKMIILLNAEKDLIPFNIFFMIKSFCFSPLEGSLLEGFIFSFLWFHFLLFDFGDESAPLFPWDPSNLPSHLNPHSKALNQGWWIGSGVNLNLTYWSKFDPKKPHMNRTQNSFLHIVLWPPHMTRPWVLQDIFLVQTYFFWGWLLDLEIPCLYHCAQPLTPMLIDIKQL